MKKQAQEFALPCFWLFFFMVSSNGNSPGAIGNKDADRQVQKQTIKEVGSVSNRKKTARINEGYLLEF